MTRHSHSVNSPRVEFQVHLRTGHRGRKYLKKGARPKRQTQPTENLPRLTRLLALAHRWNRLIDEGIVSSYTEIASLMGISRARVSQIMDLLHLAPDIQEQIFFPPNGEMTGLKLPERTIRPVTHITDWNDQRALLYPLFRSIAGKNENAGINKIDAIARPLNKPVKPQFPTGP